MWVRKPWFSSTSWLTGTQPHSPIRWRRAFSTSLTEELPVRFSTSQDSTLVTVRPRLLSRLSSISSARRGRMELVGLEDEEEGEKTLWAFPLWEKGRGGSAVVFLVERGVAEPYVLGKGAVQVTVLDLDADLEEPHHVVLGLNDDRILNEDDLGELLPPELVPEWGTFSTVEDAVEAVREILARAPEGEILKLDLEGRDDEGDTLWVRVVWEDEEDLEVSGPL